MVINPVVIHITDVKGQLIHSGNSAEVTGEYKQVIDLKEQAKGIYILQIITSKDTIIKKLLLK